MLYEAIIIGDTTENIASLLTRQIDIKEPSTEDMSVLETLFTSLNTIYPRTNTNVSEALSEENKGKTYKR